MNLAWTYMIAPKKIVLFLFYWAFSLLYPVTADESQAKIVPLLGSNDVIKRTYE